MNKLQLYTAFFCLVWFSAKITAQEMLPKEQAILLTLENNFDIKVASNFLQMAENNAQILNSGFLPIITGIAGVEYSNQNQEATFQSGEVGAIRGAETDRYNASVNLDYTIFDGLGRRYTYKSLKEQRDLSQLEVRETIEVTMLQLFTVYYEVARLTENVSVLEETLSNTKDRLKRAEYQFEYGQTSRLEVLNAQVDITTDSVNLMNARQQLANAKRDLNVVMNTDLERQIKVDTMVKFVNTLVIETFLKEAEANNVTLLQAEQNIKVSDYNKKASKAVFLPSLGLTGTYGWNEGNFPETNFLASSTSYGFTGGLNLTWNLFDGGRGITNVKNAKIEYDNQVLLKEQLKVQVKRNIANAYGNYQNRLAIFHLQQQNVITTQNNFERSNEQYKIGQISSLELRQAQINLLNAQTTKNLAKYEAKLAELEVLQLTGQLLSVDF
jgi:outer membrane protein